MLARLRSGGRLWPPASGGHGGPPLRRAIALTRHRILFLFVDGVGLAPASPTNPLATLPTPHLRRLLGGPLTLEQAQAREELLLRPLDATLDVPGLPQSATGQTALFTGYNAAQLLGHHATAYPGPRLRAVIQEHGLFRRALAAGLTATFANPFTPEYLAALDAGRLPASVTTWAARTAGLRLRDLEDWHRGAAVTWDVSGDHFAARAGVALAPITAEAAGARLAALAEAHDLTVYETFLTDLAAHGRFGLRVEEAVGRLDGLLGGALRRRPPGVTLLLTSDHGNLEDSSQPLHTRNPVPLLAVGPGAASCSPLRSILEVTPAILRLLGAPPSDPPSGAAKLARAPRPTGPT